MISKTFVAAALIAGLTSGSAMAAPRHKSASASERSVTKQLNEQQLASAGSYAATPAPSAAAAPLPPEAPAMTPPAAPTPPDASAPMASPAPPQ